MLDDWGLLGGAGTDLVASLLEELPGLTILRAADRPSGLPGESVLVVPPLPESGALAVLRSAVGPWLCADARTKARAAALCARLDGLPGALLAAAERLHGPEDLAAVERDPHDELAVRAAQRAYACSSRREQQLWRSMSVFEGEFDVDAVHEVCSSGGGQTADTIALLDRIGSCVLVPGRGAPGGDGMERRAAELRMTGPARHVGAQALNARGERWALVLRHRQWCLGLARQAEIWWSEGRQREARELALRRLADFTVAADPRTNPLSPKTESGMALEILVRLWFVWAVCGRARLGRALLQSAMEQWHGREPMPARVLWLNAWLELEAAGEVTGAETALAQARSAAEQEGDDHCLALVTHLSGAIALWQGQPDRAVEEFRQAIELLGTELDLGPGPIGFRAALALALVRTDSESGHVAVERALRGVHSPRDESAEAWLCYAQAELLSWEGHRAAAARWAQRAMRDHLAFGNRTAAACAAELAADIEAALGRLPAARGLFESAARIRPADADVAEYCAPRRLRCEAVLSAGPG
ncbi:tetratricopeptide repeat protein [Streptomyces sp. NPDC050418]|uniref:tetratricopeptide repeat protein n=1 Tax=Streptomyces sp. NPDC050418 TaxID=3365612 RepID=UPI003792A911